MARKHFGRRMAAALAVALVVSLGAAAGTAWAYYTDTNRASGMIAFKYKPNPPSTEVKEEPDGLNKVISVKNTGEVDAMVRVKVFAPTIDGVTVSIFPVADDGKTEIETGSGWTQSVEGNKDEGWWYYTSPIVPGAFTSKLKVDVSIDESKDVPAFDIAVVQQCASAKSYKPGGLMLGTFHDGQKSLIGAVAFDDTAAQNQDGE
ncbi:hypothetical protein [Adlercreutzia shanghongiae]|uniref:Uncharacterized protein n=1 Tax=Adlercreutzia shanghongiae TaxID=3111773 RepID=A0ABU6IVH6_9ACTN|nr:hypothetical protein [Adlercreutzia sp. R22]MEC4293800.1 hypothetical protein [Adlercreutzia sp. R22]